MTTEDIWHRWRASYQTDEAKSLVEDGVGDEVGYRSSQPRLLVVLKETNRRGGKYDGVKLTDQLRKGAKYTVWHRVAEWAAGFHHGFPPYSEVAQQSVKDEALRGIAAINLKKIPGTATASSTTIDAYAFRDRLLLREQLDELDPTVILCCGTFNPMCWLLESRISSEMGLHKVVTIDNGAKLIKWDHPSRRGRNKREWYADLAATWRDCLT